LAESLKTAPAAFDARTFQYQQKVPKVYLGMRTEAQLLN
jgi:hypothetical protein